MAKISGSKSSVIVGQNVFEIPTYKKYGLDKYIKQGLAGKPFNIEGLEYVSDIGKKESTRHYNGIPIKNEAGETQRLLCIVEDITASKNAEIEIRSRNEELEKYNRLTVDRELKMVELKKRIKYLEKKQNI